VAVAVTAKAREWKARECNCRQIVVRQCKTKEITGGVFNEMQRKASEGIGRNWKGEGNAREGKKGKARDCEGRQWMGTQGKEMKAKAR
jgi:hypothetical protein